MVNSVVYHPYPSRLASRIHPFIFLSELLRVVNFLVEAALIFIFHHVCENVFKFMVFTFLENALNLGIFTHTTVPHYKLQPECFENMFP